MKRKIIGIFLILATVFSCSSEAFAADYRNMTDISGHWAESSIDWCMENGLFSGISSTEFSPDTTMTRGMFVTVLGRLAGIDPADYTAWYTGNIFTDVSADAYYAPYIAWAVRYGIASGISDHSFEPDAPVTREQMAAFLVRYASVYNYQLDTVSDTITDVFSDADTIDSWALDSVDCLRKIGLLSGYGDDELGYSFQPVSSATRAECATVFCRLSDALEPYTERTLVMPTDIYVTPAQDTIKVGQTTQLYYSILPANTTNPTATWISSDPGIATVNRDGLVNAVSAGTVRIYCYTCNGEYQYAEITCEANPNLASASESYADKCYRLFGTTDVSDPRRYYTSDEEASAHMTTITIRVWDFADASRTTKITKYLTLQVNTALADTVRAIFEEIYNGDEKFPIYAVGCYRYEPGSEHYAGCAIDINWNENYECRLDGTALTGSYWKPGEDPYSIPLDGDVANAFAKYGFTQGAYWHSKRDYMHFSYFAT